MGLKIDDIQAILVEVTGQRHIYDKISHQPFIDLREWM